MPAGPGTPGVRLSFVGEGADTAAVRLRESGALERIKDLLAAALLPAEPEPAPAPAAEAPEPGVAYGPALPSHILQLGARLQTLSGLTPDQRIARAWNLGISDRQVCDLIAEGGQGFTTATPEPRLKPVIFVCLRGGRGSPFLTVKTGECQNRVRDQTLPGRPFLPGAVWRGLPSRAEAEAYLAGARFAIPPTI